MEENYVSDTMALVGISKPSTPSKKNEMKRTKKTLRGDVSRSSLFSIASEYEEEEGRWQVKDCSTQTQFRTLPGTSVEQRSSESPIVLF